MRTLRARQVLSVGPQEMRRALKAGCRPGEWIDRAALVTPEPRVSLSSRQHAVGPAAANIRDHPTGCRGHETT
jgi:hypothetical protein